MTRSLPRAGWLEASKISYTRPPYGVVRVFSSPSRILPLRAEVVSIPWTRARYAQKRSWKKASLALITSIVWLRVSVASSSQSREDRYRPAHAVLRTIGARSDRLRLILA